MLTREQSLRKGRRLRRAAVFFSKLQKIGRSSRAKELYLGTPAGRVRVLMYCFDDPGNKPVYFDLHGGGFILGSAEMDEAMNLELVRQVGCKIISIDYAKAPDSPYPAAVEQVYAVVSHVHEHAEQFNIDGQRMAIGGHSAGGNLSAVTCLKAGQTGEFQFACQVLDYPPLDLATSPFEKPCPKGAISPEMAAMFNACYVDPAQARDPFVSPVYAASADLAGLPPALFILAGMDSLHDEGLRYYEMLQSAGVAVEKFEYPNAAHGFTYKPSPDTTDAVNRIAAFLKKYLF
jgi:acetyl esterase